MWAAVGKFFSTAFRNGMSMWAAYEAGKDNGASYALQNVNEIMEHGQELRKITIESESENSTAVTVSICVIIALTLVLITCIVALMIIKRRPVRPINIEMKRRHTDIE